MKSLFLPLQALYASNLKHFSFYFTVNKNIIMSSFKSSGDIQKKMDGPVMFYWLLREVFFPALFRMFGIL